MTREGIVERYAEWFVIRQVGRIQEDQVPSRRTEPVDANSVKIGVKMKTEAKSGGAQVARWPDGRVDNMAGGIVTTEAHACPDRPTWPTNTSAEEIALDEAVNT